MDVATVLFDLAQVQLDLGRPGEAVRAGTEAVQVLRASAGSEPHALAEALVFVARIQLQGDPGQAVPLLEEAGQLLALEGVGQPAERVAVLDLLAGAYRSLGQDDKAAEAQAAADGILAGAQEILAGEDVAALLGLGQVLTERGELGLAGTALERAGAVLQARPAGQAAEAKGVLTCQHDALGRAYERRQAYPEALAAYRQALELTDAEADPRFYGVVLHDIAGVLRAQGELEEAAVSISRPPITSSAGDALPGYRRTVLSPGSGSVDLGRPGEAVRAGTEAVQAPAGFGGIGASCAG